MYLHVYELVYEHVHKWVYELCRIRASSSWLCSLNMRASEPSSSKDYSLASRARTKLLGSCLARLELEKYLNEPNSDKQNLLKLSSFTPLLNYS